ncbi:hypothetical protein BDV29DRAFT_193236 [Aspergillus leporis]|uniref:Protein kinase domain-containing protein n=1 Tax=Aspergillus leporis TaxID=41062 RepID=A0A5N5WWH2_9EURO|nr:hypothetical protein BDV29DRAFT_193236 [Aspergillus leporis]
MRLHPHQHELIDEEVCPAYQSRCFYLAKPGWQSERLVTLKIINTHSEVAHHERDIEKSVLAVAGPEGSHLCLAYEPMRELLWILQKPYILILLPGLDYPHTECGLSILTSNLPMQFKTDPTTGRTIYRCHNDFRALDLRKLRKIIPKIADFWKGRGEEICIHPIQPDRYRAPEVILGSGWSFSADIWNLGILLGPPPKELLAKSDTMVQSKWPDTTKNVAGSLCRNTREFFGGPFSNEGHFLHDSLIPAETLDMAIPLLEEKERQAFLSFVSQMLTWLSEERETARELINHPSSALKNVRLLG